MNELPIPFSYEAEQAVLAGVMLDQQSLVSIRDWLAPEDFHLTSHRAIYAAVLALSDKQQATDGVTVSEWLRCQGDGGAHAAAEEAMQIAAHAYTTANVAAHAEIVVERSRLRKVVEVGQQMIAAAMSPRGAAAADIAASAGVELGQIAPARAVGLKPYKQALRALGKTMMERHSSGAPMGLPTPWRDVNKAIGSLQPGKVYVMAARSNQGKSTLAFQQARFSGLRGTRTALFSMEMTDEDVAARDVSALGNIPLSWVVGLDNDDDELNWGKFVPTLRALEGANMLIDDDPQLTSAAIVSRAKRAHRQQPLELILVDHLHEMTLPGKQGEAIERGQALRDLKGLAKNLHVPVVVLAQLNRGAADGKRPQIADIRGSGGIEEVADVILFIHRPEVYDPSHSPGQIEVIVGKGRNIKTGTVVTLRNRFEYQRADDMDCVSVTDLAEIDRREREREAPAERRGGWSPGRKIGRATP